MLIDIILKFLEKNNKKFCFTVSYCERSQPWSSSISKFFRSLLRAIIRRKFHGIRYIQLNKHELETRNSKASSMLRMLQNSTNYIV